MDRNITRRGLLWLAAVGVVDIACSQTPVSPAKPANKPTPSAQPANSDLIRGVPAPGNRVEPGSQGLAIMEKMDLALVASGRRVRELAKLANEFKDVENIDIVLTGLDRRAELGVSTNISADTFMRITPNLFPDPLTKRYANPKASISFHPDFFSLPQDDQVLGLIEAIGVRQMNIDGMSMVVGSFPDAGSQAMINAQIAGRKTMEMPGLYFKICEKLAGLKRLNPNYKTTTQRLVYERPIPSSGQQSLYAIYQRVITDANPAQRNATNPLWRETVRQVS